MRSEKKYHGVIVPAVTPLTADHKLDREGVVRLFDHLYKHDAVPFIMGTTGESVSLPDSLKKEYLQLATSQKKPGTRLYAGISGNCVEESIDQANRAFDMGVDAVAATLPSYYSLSASQMQQYFEQLAEKLTGHLIIYNIPGTTHMSIPLEVIETLSYHERVVATKDSERDPERLKRSLELWANRADFSHFLGWAAQSANALALGSDGLIPSTGNFYPAVYRDMMNAAQKGDQEMARKCQQLSDDLGDLYQKGHTLGESLWALKVMMHEFGICGADVMPPLQKLSATHEKELLESLHALLTKEKISLKIDTHG